VIVCNNPSTVELWEIIFANLDIFEFISIVTAFVLDSKNSPLIDTAL